MTTATLSGTRHRNPLGKIAGNLSAYRWVLLILFAHLPLLVLHFQRMWQRPHQQYFPIVLFAVVGLLATRIEPLPTTAERSRLPVYTMLGISLALLCTATFVVFSPWLGAVAFVFACGAGFLLLRERYFVRNLFGIWVLLWLLIPLPGVYDDLLSQFLQRVTTVLSGRLLEGIGIPNLVEGMTLALPGRQLFVDEACSGIVSMMAIVAACFILAVWANRPWLHAVILILSGVALAAVTNVLRIVTLAIAQVLWEIDLTTGWPHGLLGLCLFMVAVGLALSTDRLLHFLLDRIGTLEDSDDASATLLTRLWNAVTGLGWPPEQSESAGPAGTSQSRSPSVSKDDDRVVARPAYSGIPLFIAALAFVATGVTSAYAIATHGTSSVDLARPELADQLTAESLPKQLGEWRQIDFSRAHVERLQAQDSRVWSYQNGGMQATFSCDFSFDRWHDLTVCYEGIGWSQSSISRICAPATAGDAVYQRCRFDRGNQQHGMLMFSLIDEQGNRFDPPGTVSMAEHLRRRLQIGRQALYQIQLWVVSDQPLSFEQQLSAEKLFQTLRQDLIGSVRSNSASGSVAQPARGE